MGHWEDLVRAWWETNVVNCSFCGQMIPKRQWVTEMDGQRRVFCSPDCAHLHQDYWVPRHGNAIPSRPNDPTGT